MASSASRRYQTDVFLAFDYWIRSFALKNPSLNSDSSLQMPLSGWAAGSLGHFACFAKQPSGLKVPKNALGAKSGLLDNHMAAGCILDVDPTRPRPKQIGV